MVTLAARHRAVWLCALLAVTACSMLRPAGPTPLATSLQGLVPHADGDHLVYLWSRPDERGGVDAGIQVERVTAAGPAGEFEVTTSEDGIAVARSWLRDDGHALLLLSEDFGPGERLRYVPPLLQLEMPLVPGERRAAATAEVTRRGDDEHPGSLQVTQVVRVSAAAAVHTALGDFSDAVSVQTVRSVHTPEGIIELSSSMVLVPGIGEVVADGQASGAAPLHRELACARISGRSIGDCHNLIARVEQLRQPGPSAP
jgi:hypothetical protein